MKKSDLKTGYLVEIRDGSLYNVVLNNVSMKGKENTLVGRYGIIDLEGYNEDMIDADLESLDIVKVYLTPNSYFGYTTYNCELLWEREEKVEMTVAEIEEKLGVKNLKIVK